MGGKDLFLSKRGLDGSWNSPQNLGYPLNTEGDERSIIITRDGKKGIVSSSTSKGFGSYDIFDFDLPEDVKPAPVTFVRAKVFDKESKLAVAARAEIIDVENNQTLLITTSDKQNGSFLACLPAGKEYALNVTANGYLFYSDNFNVREMKDYKPFELEVPLVKVVAGETVVLKNIFFNSGSAELSKNSRAELEKIAAFMKINAETSIELGGHTDNTGTENINKQLSLQRANNVKTALMNLGIVESRIKTMGYGASKPIAANDTEEGKELNRRTELKIL
jgi:outer membrane protein OmpA-like peptidoglycan-associated protein